MGIGYCLIRVEPATVAALRGRPRAAAEFIYRDADAYDAGRTGLFTRLFGKKVRAPEPVPERREGDEIDLDKAWHIVHYLLTGATDRAEGPLRLIGDDLDPLADLDLGLGRPNVISVRDVQAFTAAAKGLDQDAFLARFIPNEMPLDELYLGEVIARGDHEDMKEYATENFHILRDFVQLAADEGDAIITYYT